MEDIKYLMIMSTQTYWNLRISSVNPCDTGMLPHHQSVRELCTGRSYSGDCPPSLSPWNVPWGPLRSSGLAHELPCSPCMALAMGPSPLPLQVLVWPPCGLDTWTWIQQKFHYLLSPKLAHHTEHLSLALPQTHWTQHVPKVTLIFLCFSHL